MISLTFVLATGVKLIMIPFASARKPKPRANPHLYYNKTFDALHMTGFPGLFVLGNLAVGFFDNNKPLAYNTMQP